TGSRASFTLLVTGLEAHQRARECREIIEAEGLTVTGRDGQPRAHPLINAERDARRSFAAVFKKLGIKGLPWDASSHATKNLRRKRSPPSARCGNWNDCANAHPSIGLANIGSTRNAPRAPRGGNSTRFCTRR